MGKIEREGSYKKIQEKVRGQVETSEYYQTEDIKWLNQKKKWKRIKNRNWKMLDERGKMQIEPCFLVVCHRKQKI